MSATNGVSTDGPTDDFLHWDWITRINVFEYLRPEEREALLTKLRLLHTLPRERWAEQEVFPLSEPLQETYLVPFTDDWNAYLIPQPDGSFRVVDMISQERLDQAAEQLARMGQP